MQLKINGIDTPFKEVDECEIPLQVASLDIWEQKYQLKNEHSVPVDNSINDTFRRAAKAIAGVEKKDKAFWEKEFLWALKNGAIFAGRILSNAGAEKYKPATSTINCTVSGTIFDSMDDILFKNHEAGLTLKAGCGIGYEFSTLRPRDSYVSGAGAKTSGPLSFMDIFDKMCFTVSSAGGRRGAQMATFDIHHPDIFEFIHAKREDGRLRQFNLSLLITEDFIKAVKNDEDWKLSFPITISEAEKNKNLLGDSEQIVYREFPVKNGYIENQEGLIACRVYNVVKAREIWDAIMTCTYNFAEPGFILIDKVNEMNNNWFCENIRATNPCFTGNTKVWTDRGPVDFKTLATIGEDVNVLTIVDGLQVYRKMRKPRLTQKSAKLVKVTFSHGTYIRCTPNHRFYLKDGTSVEAKDLSSVMKLQTAIYSDESYYFVSSVEELTETEDVYCGTVDESHKFFVYIDSVEGVLVANCGEQPLPPYGSCLLGSVNLTKFVVKPFTEDAYFDFDRYEKVITLFTRMLDNVVEINGLPLKEQREEIESKRRHGMGILGLGSTLTMLRIKYGSEESIAFTEQINAEMAITGLRAGVELAKEKGMAPILKQKFEVSHEMLRKRPEMIEDGYQIGDEVEGKVLLAKYSRYMQMIESSPEMVLYDEHLINDMYVHGCRFTHHTSIAPTGTISLSIGNNASNGIEPSFAHHYSRNVIREGRKTKEKVDVFSFELLAYRHLINPKAMPFSEDPEAKLPDYFISADEVSPKQHVDIQAAAQKWVDSSISKTANIPTDFPYEVFKDIYMYAYDKGLKGCTTFRFNPEAFQGVLVKESDLENTTYEFTLEDGSKVVAKGNEEIEYDGGKHSAANLFDALKEGTYGKY